MVSDTRPSSRAPLPRTLQVIKDADNRAQDALTLANIKEQLLQASEAQFDGELRVGELLAVDSKANEFLQFADLFVGSANRFLMRKPRRVTIRRISSRFRSWSDLVSPEMARL